MRTLVFVHGGPGLTTVPEERWFGADLRAAGIPAPFWNEPSRTRPDGPPFVESFAFRRAVDALAVAVERVDEPVFVAHSFGIHYVLALPNEVLARVMYAVLIAPSLALAYVADNDGTGRQRLADREPEKSAEIRQLH